MICLKKETNIGLSNVSLEQHTNLFGQCVSTYPSTYPSIHPVTITFINHLFIYPFICPLIPLPTHPFIHLFVYLFIPHPSIDPSVHWSMYPFIHPFIYTYISLPILHSTIHPPLCLLHLHVLSLILGSFVCFIYPLTYYLPIHSYIHSLMVSHLSTHPSTHLSIHLLTVSCQYPLIHLQSIHLSYYLF